METEKNTQQQVTKAFYNCFANASFHRLHQFITTIRECRASAFLLDTKKKVSSNPRYFLSNALFQTQKSMTTRSILDSSHDFVLVSRLNFQHIHYSVFPAVVSSSFHLFQIHRLIKTRSNKNSRTFMVLL